MIISFFEKEVLARWNSKFCRASFERWHVIIIIYLTERWIAWRSRFILYSSHFKDNPSNCKIDAKHQKHFIFESSTSSNVSREIPHSLVTHQNTKLSFWGQHLLSGPEGHLFDSARGRAQFSFLWTSLWTLLWSIALEYETFYLFIQGSSEKIGTLMKWNCRYLILTMLNLPVLGIFNRKTTYSQCVLHITAPMSSVGSRNSTELHYRAWNILQPVLVFFIEIHLCTAFAQIPVEISRFEIIPDSLSLSLSRFVSNSPRVILS